MNYLDTLYRALIDYRKNTFDNKECKSQRAAVIRADNENDKIEVTRQNCIVEEDWIEAIEHGLEFIEKAIKEERQFIRSNGEVIPIEKVKRVSKDSVEHLARHSNYFTREQEEGKDLIPDQLYTVERLSDYAVYENRFLYMLLCYLRDFIGMRYEKIVELTNTYNGNMSMNKSIVESNRRIKFEISLEEEKKNDEYLREHNAAQKEIDRILTIYRAVIVFLNTPLMIEVAKSPMVKPPIMRTNVLKMNRNFREALSLYEFVTSYDKDGYMINTETRTLSPFVGVVADELSEMVELSLFLTYEHGLGIRDYFKENYEKEEERRRAAERKKFAEQIRNIGRQLKVSGMKPEEYILLLEKRIRDLEKEEAELEVAKKTIESLENDIGNLRVELETSQEMVRSLGDEITRLNKKYEEDIAELNFRYTTQINELVSEHAEKIQALNREFEETIDRIREEHEEKIAKLCEENESRMQALEDEHAQQINLLTEKQAEEIEELKIQHAQEIENVTIPFKEEIQSLTEQLSRITEEKLAAEEAYALALEETRVQYTNQIRQINEDYDQKAAVLNAKITENIEQIGGLNKLCAVLEQRKVLAEARLNALRSEHGLFGELDDFSTKEKTDEIENQYRVFRKFFKTEWKKTKKKLRKEVFTSVLGEKKKKKGKKGALVAAEDKDAAATAQETTENEVTEQGTDVIPATNETLGTMESVASNETITLNETANETVSEEQPAVSDESVNTMGETVEESKVAEEIASAVSDEMNDSMKNEEQQAGPIVVEEGVKKNRTVSKKPRVKLEKDSETQQGALVEEKKPTKKASAKKTGKNAETVTGENNKTEEKAVEDYGITVEVISPETKKTTRKKSLAQIGKKEEKEPVKKEHIPLSASAVKQEAAVAEKKKAAAKAAKEAEVDAESRKDNQEE